jgi:hypothetical protein
MARSALSSSCLWKSWEAKKVALAVAIILLGYASLVPAESFVD